MVKRDSKWLHLVLQYKWFIIILYFLISAISLYICSKAVVSTSLSNFIQKDSAEYKDYASLNEEFASDDLVLMVFKEENILSKSNLDKIENIKEKLSKINRVKKVNTIFDIVNISTDNDTISIESYTSLVKKNPEKIALLMEQIKADPLAQKILISKDGKHQAIILEFSSDINRPAETVPQDIAQILKVFEEEGIKAKSLKKAGFPIIIAEIVNQTFFNFTVLTPIVLVFLLSTVWVIFKRLWPVFITGIIAMLAVLWTIAFAVILSRHLNILVTLVPGVILIISFSDVIHLCSAYLLELSSGLTKNKAIMASGTDVGKACFFTSITTFCGFIAMAFVPVPMFQQLGMVLGFGVGIALLIAMTLTPILFTIMNEPSPWFKNSSDMSKNFIDKIIDICINLSTKRMYTIIGLFIILLLISIYGSLKLNIETNFLDRLPEDHQLKKDEKWLKEHFSGADILDIYLKPEKADELMNPTNFNKIAKLQDSIKTIAGVENVVSLVDLMREIHKKIAVNNSKERTELPKKTKQELMQYLFLLEMSDDIELDKWINFERDKLRLSVSLSRSGFIESVKISKKINKLAKNIIGDNINFQASGLLFLMGTWLDDIVKGQKKGLIFAIIFLAILMILGLSSIRVGLWSMLPNMLPLFALGGYLGMFWDKVDSDLMAIGMMAIGIGVDDTIHFLMRLKIEWKRSKSSEEAVKKAMHYSGRGIIITTIILSIGFCPFMLSSYLSVGAIGTLLPFCLIIALLGDILLVPALVNAGLIKFKH